MRSVFMIFNNREYKQAQSLPYNWGVDYIDGTSLTEYKEDGTGRNDYYAIQVQNIDRFGLFGSGHKYFYTRDGAFYLDGQRVDIEYHSEGRILGLTSVFMQRDCITYKDAHVKQNRSKVIQDTVVDAINFGYKTLIEFDDFQIYFQAIVKVASDDSMVMEIKATSNMNRDGKLVFKNRGKTVETFEFPLMMNYSSNLNWIIK